MAVTFHESSIPAEAYAAGVQRQRMLTSERVRDTKVLLDRLVLSSGAAVDLDIRRSDLAWFQVMDGAAQLQHDGAADALTDAHIVFLPPGFRGRVATVAGATLLYAQVPDAARFDAAFTAQPPSFRIIDWTREPVLDSEHDARKRIYLVTPKLFGTKALKGEMIIYPAGTEGANHHHEGAEHFMYVMKGRGTAYANESPIPVRQGDLIYYADRERHYLRSEGGHEMRFVEFFVPGTYKTTWAPGAPVCTWVPTGRSISGERPVREIEKHRSDAATPQDV
jgi:quercetin dioxygenase-like cupin family protein